MFARTARLLLRPGFAEDAPALAALVADERRLRVAGAVDLDQSWALDQAAALPMMLVIERTATAPRLVGGCGLARLASGDVELRLWIARRHGGRGLGGEAGTALVDIARMLGLARIDARCIDGDRASQQLLARLGFEATGLGSDVARCTSGALHPARVMRLNLDAKVRLAA